MRERKRKRECQRERERKRERENERKREWHVKFFPTMLMCHELRTFGNVTFVALHLRCFSTAAASLLSFP